MALFALSLAHRVGSLVGRAPMYIPGLVAPGEWGMFDTDDALYGKERITPREHVDWRNRVAARSLLGIPFHRPGRRAADIAIPLLLIAAEHDTQVPVAPILTVAEQAPKAELRRSRGGHYDVYEGGSAFGEVIEWEVEFLRRHARLNKNLNLYPGDLTIRGRGRVIGVCAGRVPKCVGHRSVSCPSTVTAASRAVTAGFSAHGRSVRRQGCTDGHDYADFGLDRTPNRLTHQGNHAHARADRTDAIRSEMGWSMPQNPTTRPR